MLRRYPPRSLSAPAAWTVALVATLLIGAIDYATGALGFFVFYFAPIALAAWRLGRRAAVAIAALSAAVWFAADAGAGQGTESLVLAGWNTLIRLTSFIVIGWAVARIHTLLEAEREAAEALRTALAEVRTLRGLLPMCAWCGQIRADDGEWMAVDKYLARHSDAEISHGMCEACAQRMLDEAGA